MNYMISMVKELYYYTLKKLWELCTLKKLFVIFIFDQPFFMHVLGGAGNVVPGGLPSAHILTCMLFF